MYSIPIGQLARHEKKHPVPVTFIMQETRPGVLDATKTTQPGGLLLVICDICHMALTPILIVTYGTLIQICM